MKNPYLLHKRGKVWYYRLAGQTTFHTTGETTKARAQEFCLKVLNGENAGVDDQPKTLAEICETMFIPGSCRWIKRKESRGKPVSPEMASARRCHVVNFILPVFGSRIPASITQNEIDDWLTGLDRANKTRNHILDTVRIVWRELKNYGHISVDVAEGIERFANDQKDRDIFTEEELKRLFPDDPEQAFSVWEHAKWAALFSVLAQTGMRLSEALALQWQDIVSMESGNSYFHINKAAKLKGRRIGTTKTGKPRVAPVMATSMFYLHAWRAQSPYAEPADLIFANQSGRPLQSSVTRTHFNKALRRAGIERAGRNLVTHSLRHTFNTLHRRTLQDPVLQTLTGHSSQSMINNYDHPDIWSMINELEGHVPTLQKTWADLHHTRSDSYTTSGPRLFLDEGTSRGEPA